MYWEGQLRLGVASAPSHGKRQICGQENPSRGLGGTGVEWVHDGGWFAEESGPPEHRGVQGKLPSNRLFDHYHGVLRGGRPWISYQAEGVERGAVLGVGDFPLDGADLSGFGVRPWTQSDP